MRKETLYTGNGVYFTIRKAEGMTEADFVRLTAEEGKAITNGEDITTTADVPKEHTAMWTDCEKPMEEELATDKDYQAALAEFGVSV